VLAIGGLLATACQQTPAFEGNEADTSTDAIVVNRATSELPPVPIALPTLGRRDLIAAAAAARDATASGRDLPNANKELVDRAFEIRLPFGCKGPGPDDWAGWVYNSATKALRLTAHVEEWDRLPWINRIAGSMAFDAVEGFWMRRPWTSAESCPQPPETDPEGDPATKPASQSLGIAQFFAPGSARTLRRGTRPYAYTLKVAEPVADALREYALVIKGRVANFDDGQPVHCWNSASDSPPICLIAVEFTNIAFEDPSDGKILAEWQ